MRRRTSVKAKKPSACEKGSTIYIGVKVKNEVFEAICGVFNVSTTTSGTALFKKILSTALEKSLRRRKN